MRLVAAAFILFIVSMGAVGIVAPPRLIAAVRRFQSTQGLYLIAALRLAFGGALFLIADVSRYPQTLRWLGIFVFAVGLITPLFGVERFGRILDWWTARPPGLLRAWAAIALLFGLLLGYAVLPALEAG